MPVAADTWISRGSAAIWYVSARSIRMLMTGMKALRRERPILLYFNSFFSPTASILPIVLGWLGFWNRPVRVLAPRGEFGPGALSRRPLKKKAYILFFRCLGLHRHLIWHATAPHEIEDIRRHWGADAKIVFRQNDTLLPKTPAQPTIPSAVPRAVFLGRIVEHKGLEVLLNALIEVPGPFQLHIYGAEEDDGYVASCKEIASKVAADISVAFHGVVPAEEVRSVLSGFDLLLMPTAGENFGHVIAEALSVSCPVFATPWTPWSDILNDGGGRVIEDRTPRAWADLIRELQLSTVEERLELRLSAGRVYEAWASTPKSPHLFDLVMADQNLDPRIGRRR